MNKVWQVKQTQRDEMYDNTTIYITEDYNEAEECARRLNKQYGRGCMFTPQGDFEYEVADSEYTHYYKVEGCELGIDLDNLFYNEATMRWVIEAFKNEMYCGWLTEDNGITQSYDEAKVFDNYAKAVNFTSENSEANKFEYCVCPAD